MFKTVQEIIADVLVELGLADSTNTDIYTEPQVEAKIRDAFTTIVDKRFWAHLMKNSMHDLDGEVGVITDAFTGVRSIKDIEWVRLYPFTEHDTIFVKKGEPADVHDEVFYDELFWDSPYAADKIIEFFPKTTINKVMIRARRVPTNILTGSQTVPFDPIALKHITAYLVLNTEGVNPSAEATQLSLFEQRYNDLVSNETNSALVYGRNYNYSNTFTVAD